MMPFRIIWMAQYIATREVAAGGGDGIAGPHETIPVADEAGRCTVEPAQERGVIRGHASRLHLPFDCALLIRREVNGPFDSGKDIVSVCPDDDIGEGSRRLSRVLGDDDTDPLGAGCLTPGCRIPG